VNHLSKAVVVAVLAGLVAMPAIAAVDRDGYHTYAEVQSALKQWSSSPLVTVTSIGKSAGGRSTPLVRIAAPGSIDPDARPGIFVGANPAGWTNAGTEAALDLIETLVARGAGDDLLKTRTFYVAPVLDPDAHDALFAKVLARRSGNAATIDHDVDGFKGEDDVDDLDGDGRITKMRIPDPNGNWLPLPTDPRIMVRADTLKERAGAYRIEFEGRDDDLDGSYNEDSVEGAVVDMNFPHAWPWPKPEAGTWPTSTPEAKAIVDFLFGRPNIALAIVYGHANNLLDMPRSLGGGNADLGTLKFKVPKEVAEAMGFDPEQEYTIDEIWEVAKDFPFVVQNNITKEQVAQFLGAGPATKLEDADQQLLEAIAKDYKERLKAIGQDDRPGAQYAKGGLAPWLYYQYGVLAMELDVWGIPKAKKDEKAGGDELTIDKLEKMSSDEFVALGEEKVAAFLKKIGAPPQYSASMVVGMVKAGNVTPARMAAMIKQMGGGSGSADAGEEDAATKRTQEVLAWVDANAPDAFAPWKPVSLPDGTNVEVGGLDPFITADPPLEILKPAIKAHTEEVLDLASKLAKVEIASLETTALGGGVWRVRAVAANRGFLPTHTKMGVRAQAKLPVRMTIATGNGVELVTGYPAVASERLDGTTGTLVGEWLIRAKSGATIRVDVVTQNAGSDQKSAKIGKGA